jgi:hypothetical protein
VVYPTTPTAEKALSPIAVASPIPVSGTICSQRKARREAPAVAAMTAVVATAMTASVLSLSRGRADEACESERRRRDRRQT